MIKAGGMPDGMCSIRKLFAFSTAAWSRVHGAVPRERISPGTPFSKAGGRHLLLVPSRAESRGTCPLIEAASVSCSGRMASVSGQVPFCPVRLMSLRLSTGL